jgi:hypothetical protein
VISSASNSKIRPFGCNLRKSYKRYYDLPCLSGWRGEITCNAKKRTEGVKGVETTVEAESEFVDGLQVLRADAVMDTAQSSLKLGEHEMNDGKKGFRDLLVASCATAV